MKPLRTALGAFCMVLLSIAPEAYAQRVGIAAVVGDDIITTTDVNERRDLIMATAGIPATVENQTKITPRIVQSLVDETLQLQEAKRQSLSVTEDELSKAIAEMSAGRDAGAGSITEMIAARGLSQRSLENQVRAQLAWNKVVQRKLRRNVSISQDEVVRAQQSEAASPGETELRIASLGVVIADATKEVAMVKLAEQLALELKAGADMPTLATRYIKQPEVKYEPPVWVPETTLPAPLQQVLRTLQTGEVTPPLRNPKAIEILQVLDRKTAPKQDESTEYAIKQIVIPVPMKRDKSSLSTLRDVTTLLRNNPGDCMDETVPTSALPAQAKFVRTTFGALSPDQRSVLNHLEVGDVSEPLMSPDAVRLVMLCEKIEPAVGNLPNAEKIRQQLFAEKIELEAQKHLRNLRREAFIDIKGAQ